MTDKILLTGRGEDGLPKTVELSVIADLINISDYLIFSEGPELIWTIENITGSVKTIQIPVEAKIKKISVMPYYDVSTLAATDAHDENDMLQIAANVLDPLAEATLLTGSTGITLEGVPALWRMLRPNQESNIGTADDGSYITRVSAISANAAGASQKALGLIIRGRS